MNAPSLPGCLACGGTTHHAEDCSAHPSNRVLTAAGGWCAPSAPGDPAVHLVRSGRYPHVIARNAGAPPVRQSQDLSEVTCGLCLAEAGRFLEAHRA